MIDVGSMQHAVSASGTGTKTGAADVARFLGSLETMAPGLLSATDLHDLRVAFMTAYTGEVRQSGLYDPAAQAVAGAWYRLELEVAVLKSDPSAKSRILRLLNLEVTP